MLNVISFFTFGLTSDFCLPLSVGHSSRVPPIRKKGIEGKETAQASGTVREMQQEISGL